MNAIHTQMARAECNFIYLHIIHPVHTYIHTDTTVHFDRLGRVRQSVYDDVNARSRGCQVGRTQYNVYD